MSKRDWEEAHVRDDDQLRMLLSELIGEEVPFDVRPEPNGWWRVRAALKTSTFDKTGIHWFVQHTRIVA